MQLGTGISRHAESSKPGCSNPAGRRSGTEHQRWRHMPLSFFVHGAGGRLSVREGMRLRELTSSFSQSGAPDFSRSARTRAISRSRTSSGCGPDANATLSHASLGPFAGFT